MSAIVRVDHDLCLGSRMCEIRAGHLFKVADEGLALPEEQTLELPVDIDTAVDTMHGCPTGAISVSDGH
jgi:ferredoxin